MQYNYSMIMQKLLRILLWLSVAVTIISFYIIYKVLNKCKCRLYLILRYILINLKKDNLCLTDNGLWRKGTKNIKQANKNLYKFLLKKGDLRRSKNILDILHNNNNIEQDLYWTKHISSQITCHNISDKLCDNKIEERINVKTGDRYKLDYGEKSFDTIISLETLSRYSDRRAFIEEVSRVLEDRGKLITSDILISDIKSDLLNIKLRRLLVRTLGITKKNIRRRDELVKELENVGYEVEIIDITKYICLFDSNINKLCKKLVGLDHVLIICKKK